MRAKHAEKQMPPASFHDCTAEEALARLGTSAYGLTEEEAEAQIVNGFLK